MMRQHPGDKWAYVTVTKVDNVVHETKVGAVRDRWQELTLFLRCKCGKEFNMPYHKFPGRRTIKDCGCGIAIAHLNKDLKTSVSMYIDMGLLNRVTRYAYENGKSLSKAMVELMEAGVQQVEGGDTCLAYDESGVPCTGIGANCAWPKPEILEGK